MSEPKIFIEQIGGNCPVQAEGTIDGAVFYFRSRGESWSLQVATDATGPWGDTAWAYTEDYPGEKYDAGWITEDQARAFITKGAAIYREVRHQLPVPAQPRTPTVSEPKFTKGPYCYRPQEFDDWGVIRDGRGFVVATSRNPDARNVSEYRVAITDPFEANGHLFASAPALYDALEAAVLQIEYLHGKFKETGSGNAALLKARSALAQARGERP